MKKPILLIICLTFLFACASNKSKNVSTSFGKKSLGDTRQIPVEYLNENTFLLTESSVDKSYGYSETNPIKVGGVIDNGARNQQRFLNALLGPNGEEVEYYRLGSCCHFKTPNGLMGDSGLLDIYRVYWGSKDTVNIYLNLYDEGDLKVPVGFKSRK